MLRKSRHSFDVNHNSPSRLEENVVALMDASKVIQDSKLTADCLLQLKVLLSQGCNEFSA